MNYRFISTRMHGMMDYLTAFMLPFVSRVMGWDTPVRNMHDCVAGTTGFLAATTDFEPGLVKAIPVKAHLAIDAMTGVGLLAAAAILDEDEHLERTCTACVGLFFLMNALCTQTMPHNMPTSDMSGRSNPMERYAEQRRPQAARGGAYSYVS